MTTPPNSRSGASKPTPGAKREATQRDTSAFVSERILVREAHEVVVDLGLNICGSRLKRVVRRFVREGRTDIDFRSWFIGYADPAAETAGRTDIDLAYILSYVDSTGEKAIRNVRRERGYR